MPHELKLLALQVVNLVLALCAVVYLIVYGAWEWLWVSLGTYATICLLGNSIGYHRLLTHRSFTTYRPIRLFLIFLGMLTCAGSPYEWAATHRTHHKTSDKPEDPHSPHNLGFWKSCIGPIAWEYDAVKSLYVRDLIRDKDVQWLHRNYFITIATWAVFLLSIDVKLFLFVYALPALVTPFVLGFTIQWTHWQGYRNHETDDHSYNNPIVSWLMFGEGWHNNHHAHPARWNNQHRWWELDPPSWIIALIKKPT